MDEGQKYLTVYLRNGVEFDVEGETLNDLPKAIANEEPWQVYKTVYGKNIKIRTNEIVAIKESEMVFEQPPF